MKNLLKERLAQYSAEACQAVEDQIIEDCKKSGFDLVGTLDEIEKMIFSFGYNGVEEILVPVVKDDRRYFIIYLLVIENGELTRMTLTGIRSIPKRSLDDIQDIVDDLEGSRTADIRNTIRLNIDEKRYQITEKIEETIDFFGDTLVFDRFWIKDPENQDVLLISFKRNGNKPVKKLKTWLVHPKYIPMNEMNDRLFSLTQNHAEASRIYETEGDFRTTLIKTLERSTLEYSISTPDKYWPEILVKYSDGEDTDEMEFSCHYCCFAAEDEEKVFVEYSCD